jgi:hypothetical protein
VVTPSSRCGSHPPHRVAVVPHRVAPGSHIHPASSCSQRWWEVLLSTALVVVVSFFVVKDRGWSVSTQSTLRASARSSGVGHWALAPPFSSLALSPLVMAEPYPQTTVRAVAHRRPCGSWLVRTADCCLPFFPVLLPSLSIQHPQSTLRAVARRREGGCCVVRRCALCVLGGVEANGGVSDVADLWEGIGAHLAGIPLHGSPGIPLHILTQISTLTSHLDGEEGVWAVVVGWVVSSSGIHCYQQFEY